MDNNIDDLKKDFDNIEVPAEVDLVIESAIKKGRKKKRTLRFRPYVAAVACLCIMATGFGVYRNVDKDNITKNKKTEIVMLKSEKLPTVDSYSNLQVLLKDHAYSYGNSVVYNNKRLNDSVKVSQGVESALDKNIPVNHDNNSTSNETSQNYSETNQQVKGVDEGDFVKTDGKYIYTITGNKLVIVSAVPGNKLSITSQLNFDKEIIPTELFVKDNYLIVIGNQYGNESGEKINADSIYFPSQKTKIYIYDIKDKKNPSKVRELELDGSYAQSRLIDSSVYIVSNKGIPTYNGDLDNELPTCKDSVSSRDIRVDYNNVNYCPNALAPNYIILGCINLDKVNNPININTVLGSGSNIYVSNNNLYVAGYNYSNSSSSVEKTTIYKFSLDKDSAKFVGSGEVKGNLLNQFSMDESNNYLRVATTINNGDINKTNNNVYILNNEMKLSGALEGLATGERIYSTRFMGDRLYMVTFKQTDPLFVIELKNPSSPKVLGELKIPGFSNYLEPYDDNHIIGFGQDTVDVNEGGNVLARPVGMKIALFDVSDVSNPKQEFQTKVEGENSYSEVLNNHKALLFSKEKSLLAFPVSNKDYHGVNVYNIDLKNGFSLKGKITHSDIKGYTHINRELYIGNSLYTISGCAIKSNNLGDLKEQSRVVINDEDDGNLYKGLID